MSFTKDDLNHVLNLAHLELSEEEKDKYQGQLQNILQSVDVLDKFDLTNTPPSSHPGHHSHFLREDIAENQNDLLMAENAPDFEDGYFSVPQILGDG